MKLHTKISLVFFSIIAMLISASLTFHLLIYRLTDHWSELRDNTIPVLHAVKEIMKSGQVVVISTNRLILYKHIFDHPEMHTEDYYDPTEVRAIIKHEEIELSAARKSLTQGLKQYNTLVNLYFPDEIGLLRDVTEKSLQLLTRSEKLLKPKVHPSKTTVLNGLELQFEEAKHQFLLAIEIALKHEIEEESEREENLNHYMDFLQQFVTVTVVIMCIILLIVGWIFSKNILSPIKTLIKANNHLAQGNFNITVPESRPDELGTLSSSFKDMALKRHQAENSLKNATTELQEVNRKLEHQSTTDALTQLHNRYYSEIKLEEEIAKANRYKSKFSIIILDIDWFKQVNDQFGHSAGDLVLQTISQLIVKNVRKVDSTCRWGGEEILIICPETELEEASIMAEKLRKTIEKHDFNIDKPITASFGVAQFKFDDTPKTLFQRVDKCLYQAKNQGRNRVVSD